MANKTSPIYWAIVDSYLGSMMVAASDKGVCRLSFDEDQAGLQKIFPKASLIAAAGGGNSAISNAQTPNEALTIEAKAKFGGLLNDVIKIVEDPRKDASHIPLDTNGTQFQESVWQELRKIPAGETCSYADIAKKVGRPDAVRATGTANGANRIAILIPCHRVIRSDGHLGGYAYGLERKMALLERENTLLL